MLQEDIQHTAHDTTARNQQRLGAICWKLGSLKTHPLSVLQHIFCTCLHEPAHDLRCSHTQGSHQVQVTRPCARDRRHSKRVSTQPGKKEHHPRGGGCGVLPAHTQRRCCWRLRHLRLVCLQRQNCEQVRPGAGCHARTDRKPHVTHFVRRTPGWDVAAGQTAACCVLGVAGCLSQNCQASCCWVLPTGCNAASWGVGSASAGRLLPRCPAVHPGCWFAC